MFRMMICLLSEVTSMPISSTSLFLMFERSVMLKTILSLISVHSSHTWINDIRSDNVKTLESEVG